MIKRLCDICGSDLVMTPVRTSHEGHTFLVISKRVEGGRRGVRGYQPDLCAACYEAVTRKLHTNAVRLLKQTKGGDDGKVRELEASSDASKVDTLRAMRLAANTTRAE